MIIDVFSDPVCPWCYIGKRRLERAFAGRDGLSAQVRWRAFQLNPQMPKDGMDRRVYLAAKFGSTQEAGRLYEHIGRVGRGEGIDFAFDRIERTPNTILAHRLIRYGTGKGLGEPITEAVFRAYFLDGRNIGEIDALLDLAEDIGIRREEARRYLESDRDEAEIRQEDAQARQLGVDGVPCFIVNGRYAISGAQEPEAFYQLFDLVEQEEAKEAAAGD